MCRKSTCNSDYLHIKSEIICRNDLAGNKYIPRKQKIPGDVVVIRISGYYGLSPIPPSRVRVSPFMYLKSGEAS